MAKAGFCAQCGTYVWVAEDGSCTNGHPPAAVSNVYEAAPVPYAAPVRKPLKTWVVVLLVVVALGIPTCGILTAIAVPVFLNASSQAEEKSCFANQRVILGAYEVEKATNEGAEMPSDYDELMDVVVPELIQNEPRCPSDGTYSITPYDGELNVSCSVHGSVDY